MEPHLNSLRSKSGLTVSKMEASHLYHTKLTSARINQVSTPTTTCGNYLHTKEIPVVEVDIQLLLISLTCYLPYTASSVYLHM
jgi:hypothetical protein